MERQNFAGIPIGKLFGGRRAPVDLYLALSPEKYIKVVKSGDEYDVSRLQHYEDREVNTAFILSTDLPHYVEHCNKISSQISKMAAGSSKDKLFALCRAADALFLEMAHLGFNANAYKACDSFCETILRIIEPNQKFEDLIEVVFSIDDQLARHATATAIVAALIGHGLKWKSKKNLKLLTLAGLLHDVGKVELPEEILKKSADQLSEDEIPQYQEHSQLGHDLILKITEGAGENLATLVLQHHELPDGSGFPKGLHSNALFPLTKCLTLANRFSHLLFDENSPVKSRSFHNSIQYLKLREENFYPEMYWQALQSWSKLL